MRAQIEFKNGKVIKGKVHVRYELYRFMWHFTYTVRDRRHTSIFSSDLFDTREAALNDFKHYGTIMDENK